MSDRDNAIVEWIGAGIVFALMMQIAPFRWAVYALLIWLGFLAAQDWWSEHELPANSPAIAWGVESEELSSTIGDRQLQYSVQGWFQNRGEEALESATLLGRLYECDAPDDPTDRCIPVDEVRSFLNLDLKPGFRTHFSVYPTFDGAGGPNPRVIWTMREVLADNDWDLDE